jgi:ribosome-associated protein
VATTQVPEGIELLGECVRLLQEKHVLDLRGYDVRGVSSITDFHLVGSVRNERQMKAAGQNVTRQLKTSGVYALHRDGAMSGPWVVLDYFDCIVHLFTHEAREYYNLEGMWPGHEIGLDAWIESPAGTAG